MATENTPTKEDILENLSKNGINNLDDLIEALMPETGGYREQPWHRYAEENFFKLSPGLFAIGRATDQAITGDDDDPIVDNAITG